MQPISQSSVLPTIAANPKLIDEVMAGKSLASFAKQAWSVVDPHILHWGWYVDAICEHLEACESGQIQYLIINLPFRMLKSYLCSVAFPAWAWLRNPSVQFFFISYAIALALRDAVKTRNLIESKWYQGNWGDAVELTEGQNQKSEYSTKALGTRQTTGFNASITGFGGDYIILDDPNNTKKVESDVEREKTNDTFDQAIFSRRNDMKTGVFIAIQQRTHVGDFTGYVLKKYGGWTHLNLPMEFVPEWKCKTSIGWEDPRTEPGESLHPERFGPDEIEALKQMGNYAYSSQCQQNPTLKGGAMINLEHFGRYDALPVGNAVVAIVQVWDTAQKADQLLNNPWVCATWLLTYTNAYLVHVYRERMTYPEGRKKLKQLASKYQPNAVVIEDKSTGQSLLQEALEMRPGVPVPMVGFEPEGDKITRMATESPILESGYCMLPNEAPWLFDFEDEVGHFPYSNTMDQVDTLSMFLKWQRTKYNLNNFSDLADFMDLGSAQSEEAPSLR